MILPCSSRGGLALTLVLPLVLTAACGDDGAAEGSTSASTSDSSPTEGSADGPSEGPSMVEDSSASGSTSPGTSGPDPTTGSDTTGEVALCNGWEDDGPATPWLELYDANGDALASGGTLTLQCGGQGSWMFPIFPHMGGWALPDANVLFAIEVVVEGFPGPFGSFYQEDTYFYSLSCPDDDLEGGFFHDCISVLPPDDIADLGQLDGAPTTVHVELQVDGGEPLVIDLVDLTLSAPADVVAKGCLFY